ncbi:MAG: Bug family tripartite tricarboxylate transporter substrate binding protein [Gammaproteobacteria bacterium]
MSEYTPSIARRQFLRNATCTLGAVGLASLPGAVARAEDFPSRNVKVVVPTREGGGADRNLRAFTSIWKKYLDTSFEPGFYPGAAGRVGYEVYMGKQEPDCYNLLFGNMGPEVLNWAVQAPTFDLDDYFYFARVDTDPGCLFVSADSRFQTVEDVVAEGRKRTLNVGTSRLAHPASIGCLLLGEHTGAKFNLIPLSGGKNTVAGVVTGEMDCSVLTSGTVAAKGDALRTLLVFNDENVLGPRLSNAPTMNAHFGTDIPPLLSARAFAIHTAAAEKFPERFRILNESIQKVFADPDYKAAVTKAKGNWEYINYGDAEACKKYVTETLEIGARFKAYLTGKS